MAPRAALTQAEERHAAAMLATAVSGTPSSPPAHKMPSHFDELLDLSSMTTRRLGWEASHLGGLTDLILTQWRTLAELSLSGANAPCLRKIDVGQCELLATLTLREMPSLACVHATRCPRLSSVELTKCNLITEIKLPHCKVLRTLLAPHATRLEVLSLFGCRAVSATTLEILLGVAGGALRSLDLNGTSSTQSVTEESIRQRCPGLAYLDARGRALKF